MIALLPSQKEHADNIAASVARHRVALDVGNPGSGKISPAGRACFPALLLTRNRIINMSTEIKKIFVTGFPSLYGGAGTELHHQIIVWRKLGMEVHLITESVDDLGRNVGYTYAKNGAVQQTVTTGYGTDGRIATAGFMYGGVEKRFNYGYLLGSNLLQTLTMPCNMTLTQSYETQRNLLIGMAYCSELRAYTIGG